MKLLDDTTNQLSKFRAINFACISINMFFLKNSKCHILKFESKMLSLLLALFVVTKMWNNYFWLIIAVSPPHYKGNVDWNSACSPKNGGGHIFPQKREVGKVVEEG